MKDNKKIILFTLLLIGTMFYFFANFQRIAVPGAIFDILQGELNVTASHITAFGAIFMYVYALTQLINGVIVDRFGGFRIMLVGAVVFTLGTFLFPISSNLWIMYFSRALLGFGGSMFYLSLLKILKEIFSDKNYGIAISVMLCIGYTGAIAANAPFIMLMKHFGWREILLGIGVILTVGIFSFALLSSKLKFPPINKEVVLRTLPFRLVLHKKHNRNLFSFACCNFGISYVIQAIIGKKFLQDFCLYSSHKAAVVLSIMAIIAALFNIINATLCKICHNHRVIFLKNASVITAMSLFTICICLALNIKTGLIAVIFCILAANASLTSLLVPVLHLTNRKLISSTAVSIMNFCFFMMVGILGSVTGFILNLFPSENVEGVLIYGNHAYLAVFGVFFALSLFEMYKAMKLSNKY